MTPTTPTTPTTPATPPTPPADEPPFIHDTAIVEQGAQLGAGTRVWHHAHVRSGAVIGEGCNIAKNVYVDNNAVIGNRCKIQNNVSVYEGVTLEDEVFVGPSAVFTNDLRPRANPTEWQITPTLVCRNASVGANAAIVCGNTIGAEAMIGSGAVVTRDIEPNELVVGNPARRIGWVCSCGAVSSRNQTRPDDVRCDDCQARTS